MGLKRRGKSSKGAKTAPTKISANTFINSLLDKRRQRECNTLLSLMREVTGAKPVMWGSSIVGFGEYSYEYASGRKGDWPRAGFSPRKRSITVYCMPGFSKQQDLLERLGPHKTSVSCLYIRKLDDVDLSVLRKIIDRSMKQMATMYPA